MPTYKLKQPLTCVERAADGMKIIDIPTDTLLKLPDTDKESGIIEIIYRGRNVSVFAQDLRDYAIRMDGTGA